MHENNKRDNFYSLMMEQQKPTNKGRDAVVANKAEGESGGSTQKRKFV